MRTRQAGLIGRNRTMTTPKATAMPTRVSSAMVRLILRLEGPGAGSGLAASLGCQGRAPAGSEEDSAPVSRQLGVGASDMTVSLAKVVEDRRKRTARPRNMSSPG